MSVVKAEHITKSYGENQVLKDISIHLEKGELVSLLWSQWLGKDNSVSYPFRSGDTGRGKSISER